MNSQSVSRASLRLWPGVLLAIVQWSLLVLLPLISPEYAMLGLLGGMGCVLLIALWWLLLSRARWLDRLGVLLMMTFAIIVNARFLDETIAAGAGGRTGYFFPAPVYCLALVIWAVATRHKADRARWAWLVVGACLACVLVDLVRMEGVMGDIRMQLAWRWSPTAEERLLARRDNDILAPSVAPGGRQGGTARLREEIAPAAPAARWPGFRGPGRDAVVHGERIITNWATTPPQPMWRHAVGPGWSSFAVDGDLLYTQEQRGDDEVVSCYRISTGEAVWQHRDPARFWEPGSGAGPRATPALSNGRVYALGATGILNALDAGTGSPIWTRNAANDTGAPLPGWGFAGSPLVVEDTVFVSTSGRLGAYDAATGELRWTAKTGGGGYSSPQLATLDGVTQVLLSSGAGLTSFAPEDGTQLWAAPLRSATARIIQPAVTPNGDILVTMDGEGLRGAALRRIAVRQDAGEWTLLERWTSRGLKPKFNDLVLHQGHAYGFDGGILSCIDLADGEQKWKGGRYGSGQLILLADEDLLLVLSEEGEIALVKATPDRFTEVAKAPAIEGKTWTHPALVDDVLLVRNDHEMAALRLALLP